MKIKFKDVKRFCRFKHAGKVWTRTKGRYARPAGEVEDCKGEWPIDLETEVETVDDTQESMKARAIVNRLLESEVPVLANTEDTLRYIATWKFCRDPRTESILNSTSLRHYFGKKKMRCPPIDTRYLDAAERWLSLSNEVGRTDVKYATLISSYCHQIANVIIYEGLFGSSNIGHYSGSIASLPVPAVNDISEWFEQHYHPKNIVRQILYAVDNYAPVRVIEGKA